MDLPAVVGRNIKLLREQKQLPQDELAHLADVHVTYLSGMENGRRNATLRVIERLARALNVAEATLLDRGSRPLQISPVRDPESGS